MALSFSDRQTHACTHAHTHERGMQRLTLFNPPAHAEVNRLKNEISELEDRLAKSQAAYKQARRSHSTTQDEYHRIQQEINSLSSSKNTWTDDQFRYFQNLLASDRLISNKLTVLDAQTREQEHAVDTGTKAPPVPWP